MMLLATLLDTQQIVRNFSLIHSELDLGVSTLNSLIRQGNQLLEVALLEGEQLTQLSIESFDGESPSDVFQQLIAECQQLVSRPLPGAYSYHQSHIDSIIARRLERHGICIKRLREVIHSSEQRLEQMQSAKLPRKEVINLTKSSLDRFRQCLASEQASLQQLFEQSTQPAYSLSAGAHSRMLRTN